MQHMDPNAIFEMSEFETLINSAELMFLLSIDYMKNCYILEQIRILETPKLFSFFCALYKIDGQKHIADILLNGTYVCTM